MNQAAYEYGTLKCNIQRIQILLHLKLSCSKYILQIFRAMELNEMHLFAFDIKKVSVSLAG